MKIAINKCYGGFGVSEEVLSELGFDKGSYLSNELFGIDDNANYDLYRADERLISAIEEVGLDKASDSLAEIVIVDIPDGVNWEITDYDGMETVHETHRSW